MARPMGIVIRPRHDARDVVVPVGSSSKLGRAQLPVSLAGTEDAAYVSRVQAVVSSLSQHASSPARGSVVGYLETPKEARNPTRLDKFDGRRVFVEPGNRQELHVGDGIGLLWRNDDIMAEVAWAAQPGSRPPQLDATGPSSQDVAANGSSVQQRVDGAGAAAQDTQAAAASGLPGAAQQGGPRPVMLMLCGAQGAGKSTFATAVVQAAAQHVAPNNPPLWVRVNQDSINDGERGTRAECVRLAAESLRRGASVLIDRCNFDRAQRYDFVALAHETGVEVHAIVLGLPLAVCRERVAARMDHEGGVQGDSAARLCSVPHSKLKADPPQLAEGLDSVCTCTSDRAVAKALAVVQRWRPGRPLRLPGADTPIGWTRVRGAGGAAAAAAPAAAGVRRERGRRPGGRVAGAAAAPDVLEGTDAEPGRDEDVV
ncbi:unnamed protein product [Pedinophyceae sp. YPF-701]|nr:unnamed protein product [Pedinophyceae sp. YPF-701]